MPTEALPGAEVSLRPGGQAQELRAAGKEPYAYGYARTHLAAQLQEQFRDLGDGESADVQARVPSFRGCKAARQPCRRVLPVMKSRWASPSAHILECMGGRRRPAS